MSDLGRIGVWSMELRSGAADGDHDAIAELEQLGYTTVWIPGLGGQGALQRAEQLLGATQRINVATGVLGLWSHDPEELAAEHRRLNATYDGRLLTGIGASSPGSAEAVGKQFPGAVTAMNDYLDRIDAAATPIPQGERVLAALGPKMTELAARRARGSHPFLVTPQYVADSRDLVGDNVLIAPHQAVVLAKRAEPARAAARLGIGAAIGFPSYRANLRRMGFGDDDLVPGGSDRLIDAVVAWGDVDAIAERIREHHEAGADHVAMQVLAPPDGLPVRDAWEQLSALL